MPASRLVSVCSYTCSVSSHHRLIYVSSYTAAICPAGFLCDSRVSCLVSVLNSVCLSVYVCLRVVLSVASKLTQWLCGGSAFCWDKARYWSKILLVFSSQTNHLYHHHHHHHHLDTVHPPHLPTYLLTLLHTSSQLHSSSSSSPLKSVKQPISISSHYLSRPRRFRLQPTLTYG